MKWTHTKQGIFCFWKYTLGSRTNVLLVPWQQLPNACCTKEWWCNYAHRRSKELSSICGSSWVPMWQQDCFLWPGFISLSAPGGQNSGKVLPNSCALSIGAVRWWQGEEYPERFLPQFLLQRLIPFCFSEFLLPAGLKKLSGQFRLLSKLTGTFPGLRCSELQERNVIFKEKSNVWILHTECNLYQYKWRQPIWFYCQSTRERLFGSAPRAPTAKCLLSKSAEQ